MFAETRLQRVLKPWFLAFTGALMAFALPGCDGGGPTAGEGAPRVQVLLKDLPVESIASAEVWISRVYLVGGGQAPVDLFNDPDNPHHFDLLELRDGVTAELSEPIPVPDGGYGQLRLVVDSARVTLANDLVFQDGSDSATLFVPSGAQSGIKVQLNGDIEAEPGSTTILLVDFDVERNFVFQGNPESGIHGVIFTPVLVEEARAVEND